MTYHNAIKLIKSAPTVPPKEESSSERINKLFDALGNPQKKIKYIRLAGSNGKTLCARMLLSILKSANVKSGCLSMPVYDEIRDNIRIDGDPISIEKTVVYIEQLTRAIAQIKSRGEEFIPTCNEIMLCTALLAFVDNKCAVCILESDHNGEDPSIFLPAPMAAVICGRIPDSQVAEINRIKTYVSRGIKELVSVPQNQASYKILADACYEANCRFTMPSISNFEITRLSLRGTNFRFEDNEYSLRLCGKFQAYNAVLAIVTAEMLVRIGYDISSQSIKDGLANVTAPCKFEVLSVSPTIIADSTHSDIAISTMCDTLLDFKNILGPRIRLCMPSGELISSYVEQLKLRGYTIEKITELKDGMSFLGENDSNTLTSYKSVKLAIKDALNGLENDVTLLISGPINFTRKLRYELLATLGF